MGYLGQVCCSLHCKVRSANEDTVDEREGKKSCSKHVRRWEDSGKPLNFRRFSLSIRNKRHVLTMRLSVRPSVWP
jgi:hypothetical protein